MTAWISPRVPRGHTTQLTFATRIWRAEQEEKWTNPHVLSAVAWRLCRGIRPCSTLDLLFSILESAGLCPAAMPLASAAQRARRSAGRYSSFHFYSRFSFALPAKLDVPSFLYWFRITTSLITHVSQLLGTRLGLLASICQSTTRTQVMTRL